MTDLEDFARGIAARGKVTDADVASLRCAIYSDGLVSREEAAALFAIERTRKGFLAGWSALFVEALTDYSMHREPPEGYLADETASWLITEISKRKPPSSDVEIALLIKIVETAREVPPAFSAFALGHVKSMVIYGGGTDARGRPYDGGRVSEADVDALQRILWGAGSEGLMAVSRDEAEMLVSIAEMTAGADNDPRFDDLFAKAIGNYLLGATGRSVPPREVSLRWETEDTHLDAARLVRAVMQTHSSADWSKFRDRDYWVDSLRPRSLGDDLEAAFEAQLKAREAADDAASIMTPDKAAWLLDHIGRNGRMTAPEKALARFIARNASRLDPALAKKLDSVGA
ncbi:MAG: hypothetical protein JSS20_12470 [Proteobacteria bacterium]|nr:hypothetical protein [Pseudomonadota bacterium]